MFDAYDLRVENGESATISIKDWLLLDCVGLLNIIPILGSIAMIIIYGILAFGSKAAPSIRNRLLASFIWLILWAIVSLAVLVFAGESLLALADI